jgi:hypothetical protein
MINVQCGGVLSEARRNTGEDSMKCQGVIHGNVVILDEDMHFPDGVRVTVTVEQEAPAADVLTPEALAQRRTLVAHMQAFGQRLAGRSVCLGDRVLEGREELEDRA